ncbi:MAG: hypothetical protein PHV05_03245 [Candidatus Riflebacteria bacterium]|nr:hypothetical protein [Candidatus Riflebacteria bacterium]
MELNLNANPESKRFSLLYIFLLCFMLLVHIKLHTYAFDDAFIHFRVAQNLVETGNPYYNPGEITKVSTSSAWTVFLAGIFAIAKLTKTTDSFPLLVGIINALISFAGLCVYTKILESLLRERFSPPQKLLFQIPCVAMMLPASIGLMETPLALLTSGIGIYLLINSKPSGFAMISLSAYIRVEMIILALLSFIFAIIRKQYSLKQIATHALIAVIPLIIYDLQYFKTLVPHSVIAKSVVYSLSTFDTMLRIAVGSMPAIIKNGQPVLWVITTVTFFATIILILQGAFTSRERANLAGDWPLLFTLISFGVIAFYILGHALSFTWYKPLYMLPLFIACFLYSHLGRTNILSKATLSAFFLISTISTLQIAYASICDPSTFSLFMGGLRVKTYLATGKILNDEYPTASLLTSEIGGLGYSFRGRIFDAAGLASSDALAFHPMKVPQERANGMTGAIPPGYVRHKNPDIIVSYDNYSQALLADNVIKQYNVIVLPAYLLEYHQYSETKTVWNSKYLRVFVHKRLPVSEKLLALGRMSTE